MDIIDSTKNNNVKLLRKAFVEYSKELQEHIKTNYNLVIRTIRQPKNAYETVASYVSVIKKLSTKDRTIIFYGTSIKLSYKQFACLYLILTENYLEGMDYCELSFSHKQSSYRNFENNLKTFISKFHRKIFEQIKKQKPAYFKDKSDTFIKKAIKNLIFYKKNFKDEYTIYSNFTVFKLPAKVHKAKEKNKQDQFI